MLHARREPIWMGSYPPPVHMIKLTETGEVTPYVWVHPDAER